MPEYSEGETGLRTNISDDHILSLDLIRKATDIIWNGDAVRIIHPFTAHDLEHSKRVADWAFTITKAYMGGGDLLSQLETYLLLAGIYLHDIGMQCDLNKWSSIKKIAEDRGATFTCDFNTVNSSAFTLEQQQETRSKHHYLAAAWIEYAREKVSDTLHTASRSVPGVNVGDLMDICQYHSQLNIDDCPYEGLHIKTTRKRLVAAILRYADELDITDNRVDIDTVKVFNLPCKSAFIWWLHNLTTITKITDHCLMLKVVMYTADFQKYGSLVKEHFIEGFRIKNQKIQNVFVDHNISLEIHGDSSVEGDDHVEQLPAEVITVFDQMRNEDDAQKNRERIPLLASWFHSSDALSPDSMDEQIISPMRKELADLPQDDQLRAIENWGYFIAACYYNRGMMYARLEKWNSALDDYDEALRLHPGYYPALQSRGAAKAQAGDTSGALADLNAAILQKPQEIRSYYLRATVYRVLHNNTAAQEDICTVLRQTNDAELRKLAEDMQGGLNN